MYASKKKKKERRKEKRIKTSKRYIFFKLLKVLLNRIFHLKKEINKGKHCELIQLTPSRFLSQRLSFYVTHNGNKHSKKKKNTA